MTPLDQALLRSRRHRLLQRARGRVLELGGAGGVNFEHYRPAQITSVMVVGAEGACRARLARSAARRSIAGFELVDRRSLDGTDGGFDTIVATFTLSARGDLERDLRTLAALAGAGRAPAVPRPQPSPRARSGHGAEPAALAAPGRRLRGRAGPAGGATDLRLHDRRHRALRAGDADPPATVLRGRGGQGAAPRRRPQDRGEGERRAVTGTLALIGGGEFVATEELDRALLECAGSASALVLPTADAFEHPGAGRDPGRRSGSSASAARPGACPCSAAPTPSPRST